MVEYFVRVLPASSQWKAQNHYRLNVKQRRKYVINLDRFTLACPGYPSFRWRERGDIFAGMDDISNSDARTPRLFHQHQLL
jgi:hypothetical protein